MCFQQFTKIYDRAECQSGDPSSFSSPGRTFTNKVGAQKCAREPGVTSCAAHIISTSLFFRRQRVQCIASHNNSFPGMHIQLLDKSTWLCTLMALPKDLNIRTTYTVFHLPFWGSKTRRSPWPSHSISISPRELRSRLQMAAPLFAVPTARQRQRNGLWCEKEEEISNTTRSFFLPRSLARSEMVYLMAS